MANSCFYALTILATVDGKIAPDEEIRTTCPGSVLTDDFLFEMVEMHIKNKGLVTYSRLVTDTKIQAWENCLTEVVCEKILLKFWLLERNTNITCLSRTI